jgi:hypothetical protein
LILAALPGNAVSQQASLKDQLTGTWALVSNDNIAPDGRQRQLFGASPKGIMILAANGQFAQIMVRSDVPKFKIDNRLEGTPEENASVVHGTAAQFGTWSVDEANKVLITNNDGAMFPNQTGTVSKRTVALTGDELRLIVASAAGGTSEHLWKRTR